VVDGVAPEATAEGEALERPAPRVRAEALDHQERLAVGAAEDLVVDVDAVGCHEIGHGPLAPSRPAPSRPAPSRPAPSRPAPSRPLLDRMVTHAPGPAGAARQTGFDRIARTARDPVFRAWFRRRTCPVSGASARGAGLLHLRGR